MGAYSDANWPRGRYPTIAHNLLLYYGAVGVVREHWPRLKLYVDMLEKQYAKSGIKNYFCKFGDWNPGPKTPMQTQSRIAWSLKYRDLGFCMVVCSGQNAVPSHLLDELPSRYTQNERDGRGHRRGR